MNYLDGVPFTRNRTDEWYNLHMNRSLHNMIEDIPTPVVEHYGLLDETKDELVLDLLQLELEDIGVGKEQ